MGPMLFERFNASPSSFPAATHSSATTSWWSIASWRSRIALIVSLVSLITSLVTLYETLLRQPRFVSHAAATWGYLRGPGMADEALVVPVTIANHGARPGVVLGMTLTIITANGDAKLFRAAFTHVTDKDRVLFAPPSVPTRGAWTGTVTFAPVEGGRLILHEAGAAAISLNLETTFERNYGWLDDLAHKPPSVLIGTLQLLPFELGDLLVSGKRATIEFTPRKS
jgi:hypothetical protein